MALPIFMNILTRNRQLPGLLPVEDLYPPIKGHLSRKYTFPDKKERFLAGASPCAE
jgi:hypothetical protein